MWLWLAGLGGCPKAGPSTGAGSGSLDPAGTWLEFEPGKEVCLPTFADASWKRRTQQKSFGAVVQALENLDVGAARSILEALPAEHPATVGAGAVADLMDGELQAAATALEPLTEAHPTDACALGTAALAVWATGRRMPATELLQRARAQDPLDGRLAFLSWYLQIEPARDLIEALDAGLAAEPDHPGLLMARGAAYLEVNESAEAIPLLERAAELGFVEADAPLLQAYFLAGRRGPYLKRASQLGLPLGDGGAIGKADDPEAAFHELLGYDGSSLTAVFNTSMGTLRCALFVDDAPVTVANFVGLARGTQAWIDASGAQVTDALYDGTTFHRVIPEFMIQGGDPAGNGTGGPGYTFFDEVTPSHRFDRPGVLAMANRGPHTNGSQFFVTEVPTPHLDGGHTIFGQCDEASVEIVRQIARVATDKARPVEPVTLESVTISSP